MKKFMKVCAVTALVFAVIGCVLGAVGSRRAGRTKLSEVVEAATGGRVHVNTGSWWDWGIHVGEGFFRGIFGGGASGGGWDDVNYDTEDVSMFDKAHDILSGRVEKYSLGGDIRNLEIDVGGCSFETKSSGDASVYLEVRNAHKFQGYVEDGTLYIKATTKAVHWSDRDICRIILYLPDDCRFDEVDIEVGAGEMEFQRLHAEEADLEVGAGVITVEDMQVQNAEISIGAGQIELKGMDVTVLEAEVGMGEFVAEGAINASADVECSMGNVEMTIDGREEDFNYRLNGAMGNIDLGKESYSGFANEVSLKNGASKEIKVECSMGNISIRFQK